MRASRIRWLIVIAIVFLLLVGWYIWGTDWRAERRWQAYVSEARGRGVKFTLEELRPPRVAAEDDFSTSALFQNSGEGALWPLAKDALQIPFRLNLSEPQGSAHLPDWPKSRLEWSKTDPQLLSGEMDDLRAIAVGTKKFEPLLEYLLHDQRKSGNWDKLWKEVWDVESTSIPIRGCTQLLRIHAHLAIASGDARKAMSIADAQFRLLNCVIAAPGIQLDHTRQILYRTLLSGISYGLELGVWRDDDLRALIHYLSGTNAIEWHRWALQTERAFTSEFCAKNMGDPAIATSTSIGAPSKPGLLDKMKPSWLYEFEATRKKWWRNNELWLYRYFEQEIESLRAEEGVWRPTVNRTYAPEKVSESSEQADLKLAVLLASGIDSWRMSAVSSQAWNGCATIACALELHRRANGGYPASLDALVPQFLATIPLDPCSGDSFRYRLTPENYLLYSVGRNRLDDGGGTNKENKSVDWRWWAPRRK